MKSARLSDFMLVIQIPHSTCPIWQHSQRLIGYAVRLPLPAGTDKRAQLRPMSHDHCHAHSYAEDKPDHGATHAHGPASFGRAFAIGIGLNAAFVAVEATFGIFSNSVALLADAGHNMSDVLGLVIAWVASILARRPPSARYTYGLRGSSILAALFNAVFLLVAVGAIAWEAMQRLTHPEPVAGLTVMIVAAVGIVINGLTALLFASGRNSISIFAVPSCTWRPTLPCPQAW